MSEERITACNHIVKPPSGDLIYWRKRLCDDCAEMLATRWKERRDQIANEAEPEARLFKARAILDECLKDPHRHTSAWDAQRHDLLSRFLVAVKAWEKAYPYRRRRVIMYSDFCF